jgi:hypothetical protein
MEQQQQERANEQITCIVCGEANDDMQHFILCDGGEPGGEWHTGLHQANSHGWHFNCISDDLLGGLSKDEVCNSALGQPWSCALCCAHHASNNKWIGWKISEQKKITVNRKSLTHYLVHWLGGVSDPTWQPFSDVSGTSMHREWCKSRH